jgi:hypothetical protein
MKSSATPHLLPLPITTSRSLLSPARLAQRPRYHRGSSLRSRTTASASLRTSTGLGLYSLRKRIAALGGECGVRARDDGQQGSVFWFSFPYRPDHTHILHEPSGAALPVSAEPSPQRSRNNSFAVPTLVTQTSAISGTAADAKSAAKAALLQRFQRVLLVDDTQTILKITSKALRANGFVVDMAENGTEECLRDTCI